MYPSATAWRPNRRALLKTAALGLGSQTLTAATPQPVWDFPAAPNQRLAVTSYPFRALIESPSNHARKPELRGMDITQFPSFVAETFNVFNVNPLLDHFASTGDAYLAAFRAALEKAKSHIVDLGLPGRPFYAADAAVRRQAVAFGCDSIDIAAKVGSPSVRQHIAGEPGQKPDLELASTSLAELAEYGARKNVVVNVENDSFLSEDPFFLTAVIQKVDNPYLRGLPDFGNSIMGHDQEFNIRAVKSMLAHAFNMCHVKDSVKGSGKTFYQIDLAPLFKLAVATGYKGYFSMEFDTAVGEPIPGTRRLIEESLRYLTKA